MRIHYHNKWKSNSSISNKCTPSISDILRGGGGNHVIFGSTPSPSAVPSLLPVVLVYDHAHCLWFASVLPPSFTV